MSRKEGRKEYWASEYATRAAISMARCGLWSTRPRRHVQGAMVDKQRTVYVQLTEYDAGWVQRSDRDVAARLGSEVVRTIQRASRWVGRVRGLPIDRPVAI
jgi:hypothetical protein